LPRKPLYYSDFATLFRCPTRPGSCDSTPEMKLPHDLLHYVVEAALKYENGFLGMISSGADIAFAMSQTHDISNKNVADQAAHAESIVESLQAQLWCGAFELTLFLEGVRTACLARDCTQPDLSCVDPELDFYQEALDLGRRWQELQPYETLELDIPKS
jgi:hypothetical protein